MALLNHCIAIVQPHVLATDKFAKCASVFNKELFVYKCHLNVQKGSQKHFVCFLKSVQYLAVFSLQKKSERVWLFCSGFFFGFVCLFEFFGWLVGWFLVFKLERGI